MGYNEVDLTRGANKYNEVINDAQGIINNARLLLSYYNIDLSYYQNELDKIKSEVAKNQELDNNKKFSQLGHQNMQMDYEGFAYATYIDKVETLMKKMKSELDPLTDFVETILSLEKELLEVSENNIDRIISIAKKLISYLNGINAHNDQSLSNIKDQAYKYLYNALLEEEVYDKEDLLDYIIGIDVPYINENLGRIIENHVNSDERLRAITSFGLNYDYLDRTTIHRVAEKIKDEEISEYQAKQIAKKNEENERIQKQKNILEAQEKSKDLLAKVRNKKRKALAKLFSVFLIPVVTISAGGAVGKKASDNVLEYETITTTYNLETGVQVGETQIEYDENETTYVASIEEYSPWSKKDTGKSGYIRTVRVYEYSHQNEENLTIEDIRNGARLKYTYSETKKELDENDSTKDVTVLVTETTQDKTKTKPSKKFILPGLLIGLGIATIIDLILIFYYGILDEKYNLSDYNEEEKKYKISLREAQQALGLLQKEDNTYYIDSNEIGHYTRIKK